MGLFDSLLGSKSKQPPNSEQVLQQAFELFQQGNPVEAVTMMSQCAEQVGQVCGENSVQYARSLSHLATLYCASGDLSKGAELCLAAADRCPTDEEGTKEKLTQMMNAGQMYSGCGQSKEALPILQKALDERITFYGKGHAGVAYGEQVLAEAMLAEKQYAEGLKHATSAVQTFYSERHHEFPGAYAVRAGLASAKGVDSAKIWKTLADIPEDATAEIVLHADRVAKLMEPKLGLSYLEQLAKWAESYLPENTKLLGNTLVAWSNLAQASNDPGGMGRCSDMMLNFIDKLPKPADQVNMLQGIAMNYSSCGRSSDEVRSIYQRATTTAKNDPLLEAAVVTNWAIFEAEQDDKSAAPALYDRAIELSKQMNSTEKLGRSMIAKGVFLHHQEQSEEALKLLKQGTDILPATNSDAACGMMHLVALESGLPCCCHGGDEMTKESLTILAQKFFEQSGLGDVLDKVEFGEDGLNVSVSREPSQDELQRLQVAHSLFLNQLGGAS